ncbi:hypothetical protein CIT292_10993 [Citrobacter youngae ATCC 29220]|uniref:Uncharacterized protein n=1 Tax=Citrobacter youngae ATCC 29220 TaxID=500640 RepID=D4BKB6_9ENTR|nr:hypothetical protein CIT292_10993 [Citrobacter youngae ATCC 29220]
MLLYVDTTGHGFNPEFENDTTFISKTMRTVSLFGLATDFLTGFIPFSFCFTTFGNGTKFSRNSQQSVSIFG